MDSLANAQQRHSSSSPPPPLPPELWNFVVIVLICGLVGWTMRLAQHFLTFVDVRFAVNADAVLHMKDLGPRYRCTSVASEALLLRSVTRELTVVSIVYLFSLFVLENASMWHFQQLLRTKLEVMSAKMPSVRLPFEILQSSLTVACTPSFTSKPGATAAEPAMHLSLKIRSATKCVAQVLWDVKTDALLESCSFSSRMVSARACAVSSPIPKTSRSRFSSPIPVLRSLSAQQKSLRQRAADLPTFLSRVRRQNRRHRLNDDDAKLSGGDDDRDGESGSVCGPHSAFQLAQMVGEESFRSASLPEKLDERGGGELECVVEMPSASTSGPAEEILPLLDEVKHDAGNPSTGPQDATLPVTPKEVPQEPRYGAVVLIGSLDFFETDGSELNASASQLAKQSKHFFPAYNSSSSNGGADDVICQCVAIDFLPTPSKPEKFTPVVVKKLTFTRSNVYVQQVKCYILHICKTAIVTWYVATGCSMQEIFGRDASNASGECVICLEGELAAVLLPCRHFCVCRACLEEIDRCPICRAKFTTYACYAESELSDRQQQQRVELKIV